MKLMSVTSLQEPNESQFGLLFGKELKGRMKGRGWRKTAKIAVFEHGMGYYILLVSGKQAEELEATIEKKVLAPKKGDQDD
jgi:hypothetical protein